MTSKEFVAFLKGMAIGIEGIPNEEQWALILKKLMKVDDNTFSENAPKIINNIKEEIEKAIKPIRKNFPGSPPDIFM